MHPGVLATLDVSTARELSFKMFRAKIHDVLTCFNMFQYIGETKRNHGATAVRTSA